MCWLFGTIFWLYVPQTLCCTASVNNDIRQSHIIGTWHRYARAADHTRAHTLLGEREWTNGLKWNKKDVSFALACIFNLYRCRSSFYSWQTIGLFFLQRKHAGCVFVFFLIHQFIPSVPKFIELFLWRTQQTDLTFVNLIILNDWLITHRQNSSL